MSSAAQITASQLNGARSHGPATPEGRAISSRNALKHGFTSNTVVLEGESHQDYDALLDSFTALHTPRTPVEHQLVGQLAAAQWRLARAARFEVFLLDSEIEKLQNEPDNPLPPSLAAAQAFRILTEKGGALAQLHRHESSLWRAYEKARKQLHELAQMPAPPARAEIEYLEIDQAEIDQTEIDQAEIEQVAIEENEPERPPKPATGRPLPKLPKFSSAPKLPPNMRLIDRPAPPPSA